MITFIDLNQTKPGGLQVLTINLITEFTKRGIQTKLYSSRYSYVFRKLAETGIKFNHLDSDEIAVTELDNYILSSDTLVISYFMKELFYFKVSTPKFIYWVILSNFERYSYFTLFNGKVRIKLFEDSVKTFVGEMISSSSLYFMDGSTLKDTERIYGEIPASSIIPIPVIRKVNNLFQNRLEDSLTDGIVRVTYLGRGGGMWKIFPILHFAEEVCKMSTNVKFRLLIATDADTKYRQALSHLQSEKLAISYNLHLDHNDIEEFLLANSDLHVAMGTSALEGARLGIPTILVDASNRPFPKDYRYRWIFESNIDCTLGYWINKDSAYLERGAFLNCILDRYIADKSYRKEISDSCFEYTNQNHDLSSTAERVLEACEKTKSDVSVFTKVTPLLYNIKLRFLLKSFLK
jgi:hypothetical protein